MKNKEKNRSEYSKKGAVTAILSNVIKIALGFVNRKIFVMFLGATIVGLNGLFGNIVSMLAISELGIGTAIISQLYGPVARGDKQKIRKLLKFYKKAYAGIMAVMIVAGLAVVPFLTLIAGEHVDGMELYYILFLADVVISYVVAYKRSLISAHQREYTLNIIQIIYAVVMNAFQIGLLFATKSFTVFLIVKLVSRLFENAMISVTYRKDYKWVEEEEVDELAKNEKKVITTKVKALFLHKISSFLVFGTDNIIISNLFGLVTTGLYANYFLIINSVQVLLGQMFGAVIPSVGNLLAKESKEKTHSVFKASMMLEFFVTSFAATCMLTLLQPFVTIWLGDEYLLAMPVVAMLAVAFYSNVTRNTPTVFKTAAGIFEPDKHVPFIESLVNLVVSIVLGMWMGLIGVFIGTFVSSLVVHLYSYPKFVYKKLFGRKAFEYVLEWGKYFLIALVELLIVFGLTNLVKFDSSWATLFANAGICLLVPNLINLALFGRSSEFKYLMEKFGKKC
ncbi:MAG: oligosaccharide flippase family protein [Candidatus Saccharibacteria bacterium]|nr:oligosaccharide flippase family protein [Candidatus Saccharibacteria bacterium]